MSATKFYDGSGNEITQEENQRLLLNAQRIAVNEVRIAAEKEKISLEFSRYKQDCRKRALEMAHGETINLTAATAGALGGQLDVVSLADKYYNWLISIPVE
jgi:hypothetical protein